MSIFDNRKDRKLRKHIKDRYDIMVAVAQDRMANVAQIDLDGIPNNGTGSGVEVGSHRYKKGRIFTSNRAD